MTKEQELKANIAAAKILGLTWAEIDGICRVEYTRGNMVFRGAIFDIFTSPADCLAVVKKLNLMCISIIQIDAGRFDWVRYELEDYTMYGGGKSNYETYEEAVGAACLEIKGECDD